VIIFDRIGLPQEKSRVAKRVGSVPDELTQRRRGGAFIHDVQILVARHIHVDQGFQAPIGAVGRPFACQVPAAVNAVTVGPVANRLFAVEKNDINIVRSGPAVITAAISRRMPVDEAPSLAPRNLSFSSCRSGP